MYPILRLLFLSIAEQDNNNTKWVITLSVRFICREMTDVICAVIPNHQPQQQQQSNDRKESEWKTERENQHATEFAHTAIILYLFIYYECNYFVFIIIFTFLIPKQRNRQPPMMSVSSCRRAYLFHFYFSFSFRRWILLVILIGRRNFDVTPDQTSTMLLPWSCRLPFTPCHSVTIHSTSIYYDNSCFNLI